jgi:RNA polymerase sigma-70 factor (ECF subfamily)
LRFIQNSGAKSLSPSVIYVKEFMAIDIAAWYEKYGPMVIRRCRSLLRNEDEAMDAVQDVFVNLLRAEARLKSAFPSSLLYTMATNVCLNRLRVKKREGVFPSAVEELLSAADGSYEQVDAEMLAKFILEDESEETRAICFMYHADGMSLAEIGEAVGLSISGVRKRLESFKKRARLKLGENVE